MDDGAAGPAGLIQQTRPGTAPVDLGGLGVAALHVSACGHVLACHDPAWGDRGAAVLVAADQVGAHVAAVFPDEVDPLAVLELGGVVRMTARRPDATPCPVDVTVVPLADGSRLCTVHVLPADRLAHEAVRVLDVAFQTAPIGMAMYDTDGRFVRVNDAMCALLRRPAGELLGERDNLLTHPDDRATDVAAARRILDREIDTWRTEKRFLVGDGDVIWVIANMTFLRDDGGRPIAWLGQFTDITARKAEEGLWRRRADTDDLTGLASRRRSLEALDAAVPVAGAGPGGAVLVLDLDGFKAVNDAQGHAAGDRLLVAVGAALREAMAGICDRAVVGRVGGDEFVIVCPSATDEQAHAAATAVRTAIRAAGAARVGVSVGVAAITAEGRDAALQAADRAMYADKQRRARVAARLTRRTPVPADGARPVA